MYSQSDADIMFISWCVSFVAVVVVGVVVVVENDDDDDCGGGGGDTKPRWTCREN